MRSAVIGAALALLIAGCPPPPDDEGGSAAGEDTTPGALRCDKYYGPDVPLRRCVCDTAGRCLDMT